MYTVENYSLYISRKSFSKWWLRHFAQLQTLKYCFQNETPTSKSNYVNYPKIMCFLRSPITHSQYRCGGWKLRFSRSENSRDTDLPAFSVLFATTGFSSSGSLINTFVSSALWLDDTSLQQLYCVLTLGTKVSLRVAFPNIRDCSKNLRLISGKLLFSTFMSEDMCCLTDYRYCVKNKKYLLNDDILA